MLKPVQGMSDITHPEIRQWQHVEAEARRVMALYGFEELRTPIVESESLFTHSLGETTDVVQKEMYAFEDRGGRRLCLRPEGTAGVMRHAAGLGGTEAEGARWFYMGPMFRCERPQAGRKRQFHQCGIECLSAPSPQLDAEILDLQLHLLRAWGLNDCVVKINTRGVGDDHRRVAEGLRAALAPLESGLCEDCRRRINTNVLRVLDCKNEACKAIAAELPPVTTFMGDEARDYLQKVGESLARLGHSFVHDPNLVRGLDYYEHTIWEISHHALGAQNAVAGGGRYRMNMGGKDMRGVGFGIGMERVISILEAMNIRPPEEKSGLIWLVGLGDAASDFLFPLMKEIRDAGHRCRMLPGGSMKSQMRAANHAGAAWALICGDTELTEESIVVKNMATGEQRTWTVDELRLQEWKLI